MCQSGKCQPVVLASGQNHPYALAIDASNVYWVNKGDDLSPNSGAVMQVATTGGSSPIPLSTSECSPQGIAVDGASVYWSVFSDCHGTASSGEIRKIPIGGGSVTPVASGQDFPGPVARDASYVYWANGGIISPGVNYALKNGAQPFRTLHGFPPGAGGLAVDANNVYVTVSFMSINRVERIPFTNSSEIAIGNGAPGGLAIDGTSVYWADGGNNAIHKASISAADTSTATDVATNQSAPWGVAVDASGIYWTNSGNGTVLKLGPGDTVPAVIAQSQSTPWAIATDATTIYWVNQVAAGTVVKLAK
jgi:hypothetical protein